MLHYYLVACNPVLDDAKERVRKHIGTYTHHKMQDGVWVILSESPGGQDIFDAIHELIGRDDHLLLAGIAQPGQPFIASDIRAMKWLIEAGHRWNSEHP